MKDLSNEDIIHIKKDKLEYIQFKKLLEYKDLEHCFTLKPLNLGSNSQYESNKDDIDEQYEILGQEFKFDIKNICRPKQTHTDRVEKIEDGDEGIYQAAGAAGREAGSLCP